MEKLCSLIVLITLSTSLLNGQDPPVRHISQVVVESNKKFFSDDQANITITGNSSAAVRQENLGYILSRNSPAVIRNYGAYGSLTSVSIHGTGSNHTQITWNGIPLNSPTTGQADLSLFPGGFIQTVEIFSSASGSIFGSGTFGGSINLANEPDWNNRVTVDYTFTAGSFGHLGNLVMVKAGNTKFQYHVSAMKSGAQNDYSYPDYYRFGSPVRKNLHNEYRNIGLLQNAYVNAGKGHFFEAGFWYQNKTLEIPAIMGSYETSHAVQKDSVIRTYLSYRKKGTKYMLNIRSAWLSDNINYQDFTGTDSLKAIKSSISASRLMNDADFRFFISSKIIAGGGVSYNLVNGQSINYGGRITENELAVYGSLKYMAKKVIINAGIRKEFYDHLNPDPQFSAGARYMAGRHLVFRTSVSTRFRKPSLNERYWRPGGNPYLQPERGIGGELTAEWNSGKESDPGLWLQVSITGFYQSIDNWIQWIMTDSLTPVEYKTVHAGGLQTFLNYGYTAGSFRFGGNINYAYNRSLVTRTYDNNPVSEGNQLIYIPRNLLRINNEITVQHFLIGLSATYCGARETIETADRSLQLPPYTLFDLAFGYKKQIKNMPFALMFSIDNVFDRRYEIIRSYPVPGRTFHIALEVGFTKQAQHP